MWGRDGRELFFLDAGDLLHVVPVATAPTFTARKAVKLLNTPYVVAPGISGRSYDVSADGKRFLMIKGRAQDQRLTNALEMVMVLNWFEELKARDLFPTP